MDIIDATRAFVNGFSFTRSYTWPYLVTEENGLFILRDKPRRSERSIEIVAPDLSPERVLKTLGQIDIAKFALCAIQPTMDVDPAIREIYKRKAFKLGRTEGMFVFPLSRTIPVTESPATIQRARTIEDADRVREVAGSREVLPVHLDDPSDPVRLYFATLDDEVVGWVKSVEAGNGCRWVSNMQVRPAFRRRKIGVALMTHMLRDDAEAGFEHSVLLASHSGALLYAHLGYDRIGTLHLFFTG